MADARIRVPEICTRLGLGQRTVYAMLERGIIPAIRLNRRWIVTRPSYEEWEKTCGGAVEANANLERERPGLRRNIPVRF